jgi:3-deoxy-manno-octulosonate cytidylyltransferase (CMP-KDO synthetase)
MTGCGTLGVIPARYGSTRFPGKPLAEIAGRPMIRRVYEAAARACRLDRLLVATDDERIAAVVRGFGGEAVMTPEACATGMDRCAAAAREIACDRVVDIQGDEPLLDPSLVDRLVDALEAAPDAAVATPVRPCRGAEEYRDPDRVKAVVAGDGRILYFSRSPVPAGLEERAGSAFIHIGLYAFRREALMSLAAAPRSRLETAESLEQLRALEAGMTIVALPCDGEFIGVDRPADIARVEAVLERPERRK